MSFYCGVTQEESDLNAHAACTAFGGASTALGVASLANVWNIAGWVGFGMSAFTGIVSSVACDHDPPDPNFTTIAQPHVMPPLTAGLKLKGKRKKLVKPVRALDENARSLFAVGEALTLCMNRATGAEQAFNSEWASKQHRCASDYANQVARLYTTQKRLRVAMVRALRKPMPPTPDSRRSARKRWSLQRLDC